MHAFPLRLSRNRHFLVDRKGVPFMIVGDSPQSLIGNLSVKDAAFFIANRKRAGVDALWVDLLCVQYTGCRADGTTYDGIKPFTREGDLSTPNPRYFAAGGHDAEPREEGGDGSSSSTRSRPAAGSAC